MEKYVLQRKSLLVLFSYHHNNTEKIANVFAKVLNAQIRTPQQVNPEDFQQYNLVGFGSGIYSGKHHKTVLDLADKLPEVTGKLAFIFSTCTLGYEVTKNHTTLRETLQSKGYTIIDEFGCPGFNTNSFTRFFGGVNKGRPNAEDLKHEEEFAQNLVQYLY
ncbi:MAG: flavodoxin [Candidatus Thorarchaeota archaeon SMTZ-45]|nr:MAG: flavodoxin [Candidatus Thorarchaeota archaeon SMTZ-45]